MDKIIKKIQDLIQLHLADLTDEEFVWAMRELSEWCQSEAETTEWRMEENTDENENE